MDTGTGLGTELQPWAPPVIHFPSLEAQFHQQVKQQGLGQSSKQPSLGAAQWDVALRLLTPSFAGGEGLAT